MRDKQAVIETDMGTIIVDLLPEAAPNHVGYFIKNARDGFYNGTIFHRVVRQGIVQGGGVNAADLATADDDRSHRLHGAALTLGCWALLTIQDRAGERGEVASGCWCFRSVLQRELNGLQRLCKPADTV